MGQTQTSKELHRRKILETKQETYPTLEVLPNVPYMSRPVCSHSLTKPLQNGQSQCTSRATYKVNGQIMCERHAGREFLLAHLRSIGLNKKHGDKLG